MNLKLYNSIKIILFILLVIIGIGFLFSYLFNYEHITELNDYSLVTKISSENKVIVLFERDDCQYCLKARDSLNELLNNNSIKFFSVSTKKYENVKENYKIKIVPTILIFEDGEEVDRIEGYKDIDYYNNKFIQ